MGSFAGHIDEAIFFLMIGAWWMVRAFPRYIKAQWTGQEFVGSLSYTLPCRPSVPIEAILKTLFPIAGFIAEIANGGANFVDEEGRFLKVNQMQHMTIYGMFIIHGIIDIMCHVGVPIMPRLDYLSGALCFAWYGTSFGYHANMHGKEGMERMVHLLPINIMFLVAASMAIEAWNRKCFIAHVARIYAVMVLGTYFVHISFVLYSPTPFPGNNPNPNWDRHDTRNSNTLVAVMGLHLCLHLVTILVFYLASVFFLRARGQHLKQFRPLVNTDEKGSYEAQSHLISVTDEEL